MKLLLGLVLGFTIGALCNIFVVPVPAPPVIEGALLVVAMTVGYGAVDKLMNKPAESAAQCGGPDGQCHPTSKAE
jgi:XapX domain-containing protein